MEQHYLDQLTEQQQKAVEHFKGAALVTAAAGSGKTRVITYRIVHLIHEHSVDPTRIVAITFTNKAANEMKERVKRLLPKRAAEALHVSTFHSLCARLLRREHEAAGLVRNFTICDDSDSKAYITQAIALETEEDPKKVKGRRDDYRSVPRVQKFISDNKQKLNLPDDVYDALDANATKADVFYAKVYRRYAAILDKARCLDFDDLIMKAVLLLREDEYVRSRYAEGTQFLLVDESQDTNRSQYELVKLLSSVWGNVFIVGDEDQSLYSWRGAEPENLSRLKEDYSELSHYVLDRNFRSTQTIAATANELIAHNRNRYPKVINTHIGEGKGVRCVECLDPKQEAAVIVDEILGEVRRERARWSDYAILYRMHTCSRLFEELMVSNNVPHRIIGGLGFYNRAVIKDILAYLKLVLNGADDASFIRVYDKPPRGFGERSYAKLYKLKEDRGAHILTVFKKEWYEEVLKGRSLGGARKIREIMKALHGMSQDLVAPMIEATVQLTGYRKMLEVDDDPKSEERLEHIEELIVAAREYDATHGNGLLRFIEWTALMQSADEDTDDNRVHLMTCHAAKGLEFPRLYVVGAVDGVMPIVRDVDDFGKFKTQEQIEKDLEEERRVFFVALTRAERELTITHFREQFRYNQVVDCVPSRFLEELGDTIEHNSVADTNVGSYLVGTIGQRKGGNNQSYKRGNDFTYRKTGRRTKNRRRRRY